MGRRRGGVLEAALCGLLVGWLGVGRAWAQASGQPASRDVEEGLRALAAGQQAYDGLDMEQALAHLQRALSQPELARQPALRSRAWTLKVAAQLAQGDTAGALQEAQRLLAVDADAHFSPDHFPPEALAQLERLRVRSGEARTAPQAQLLVQRALHLPAAPSAAGLLAQAPRTPASAAGRGAQRAGYGLLGAGVLLLAGGVVLGLKASGRQEALAPLTQNDPRVRGLRSEGHRSALLADVGAAAGLLSVAGGAALILLRPQRPLAPREPPPRPREGGWGAGAPVQAGPAARPAPPVPAAAEAAAQPRPLDEDDLRNH